MSTLIATKKAPNRIMKIVIEMTLLGTSLAKEEIFQSINVISCEYLSSFVDRIIRELGTGTFAKAYEVENLDSREHCAVKVVRSVQRQVILLYLHLDIAVMQKLKQKSQQMWEGVILATLVTVVGCMKKVIPVLMLLETTNLNSTAIIVW